MATPHNSAKIGDFAKTVLMPGDPLRAKLMADTFMENVKLVSQVRNVYAYTGTYKGQPISVMASGMGIPSIGVYSYELFNFFGVENIVRVGSAGGYSPDLQLKDVVLAKSAFSDSTYVKMLTGSDDSVQMPSKELNDIILETAKETGTVCKTCQVHSSDVFYSAPGNEENWQSLRDRTGSDCVEMESFGLFCNARVLGKRAACLLTISDSFVYKNEMTAEERQTSLMDMLKLGFDSAIRF